MIRSMTGFGRAEASGDSVAVSVEARSVNHRHLDIAVRLPRALGALEPDVRRVVQSRLERGRVEVTVQASPLAGRSAQRIVVDNALAREYLARGRELATAVGMGGDNLTLAWVLERPGVVRAEDVEAADPAGWPVVADALGRALDELVARRTAEGEALTVALRGLLASLRVEVDLIAERAPAALARREARLRERLRALLGEAAVDESRIVAEVAVWADKLDITEELARLAAHLEQAGLLLDKGGPVGRPLEFLLQELNREVNTVASKADDLELSQSTLAAKGILEKLREQVQNLE